MRIIVSVVCCLSINMFFADLFAQSVSKYSKAKINLIGRSIQDIAKEGIEIDHGIYVKNRYFISDFSESELQIINKLNFDVDVLIDDVSAYYSQANRLSELQNNHAGKAACDGFSTNEYDYVTPIQYTEGSMGGYFTYQEMLDLLDTMASRYPNLISSRFQIDGITTYGGNQIQYVKLSDDVYNEDESEPKVLYTALHHAREPNSLSQMMFYLWYLLENYGKDDVVTKIVNETQMYFLPCVNPDGYILNETTYPDGGGLWRKNTWIDTTGKLKGVDLNRNYGFFWGKDNIGSSNNPNSEIYRGEIPFSEPETQAVRQFCLQHNFKIAQNYHTFGNYLIHPWGYNDLPTDEDVLFKAVGNVMNRENSFIMGTGTETVGYITNGDSDDWMYGEQAEKNRIYSYTPEVGPSFWPPKVDIDYLNKSCLWMNLSTALLTLNYYEAKDVTTSVYLSPEASEIKIKVTRAGLKDGECTVHLLSNTPGVTVKGQGIALSLTLGEVSYQLFELDIDPSLEYPNGITLILETVIDGLMERSIIQKQWIPAPLVKIYENTFVDNTTYDSSNTWASTSTTYVSGPTSITDSPDADYTSNTTTFMALTEPIDLSLAQEAFLNFYAKWDIENDYDYVQIQASVDNIDFIPLCGEYTNSGTRDQDFSSPLYDGLQSDWVFETVDLKLFIGVPKLWLRFKMFTDEYENRDGFYLDDLVIKTLSNPSNTEQQNQIDITLFPNITDGMEEVYIKGSESINNGKLTITDQFGKILALFNVGTSLQLSNLNLANGIYFYTIETGGNIINTGKLVIMK